MIIASAPERRCRKVVIPIAGRGTRMLPQSAVTPKALLPVVSADQVRPALDVLLREVLSPSTGIDQVRLLSTASTPIFEKRCAVTFL